MMSSKSSSFYWTGGNVPADAASYVERRSDNTLLDLLSRGSFCYVLTTRQMGKSSLMVQTVHRLRERGAVAAVVDLSSLGYQLTAYQWYVGLLDQIARALNLEEELENYLDDHTVLSPLQSWQAVLQDVFLKHRSEQLVFFIDEIDIVRKLPFSTDEFFASIRACYNRRSQDTAYSRLTFCLMGVASPTDLIDDPEITPFNIGERVELDDFSAQEAATLAIGLGKDPDTNRALMQRISYWTGGHPFLTQRLCQVVSNDPSARTAEDVDQCCERLFFVPAADQREDNLAFVRQRILPEDEPERAKLLLLYRQVLCGRRIVDNEADELVVHLKLSGVVRATQGVLSVRNPIYRRVFNLKWVQDHMPDAARRRQLLRLMRAGLVIGLSLLILSLILITLIHRATVSIAHEKLATQAKLAAIAEMSRSEQKLAAVQKQMGIDRRRQASILEKDTREAKLAIQSAEHAKTQARLTHLKLALTNIRLASVDARLRKTVVREADARRQAKYSLYLNGYLKLQSDLANSAMTQFDERFAALASQNRQMHLPSFEIDYLHHLRHQEQVMNNLPGSAVVSLVMYPDGKRILAAGSDGSLYEIDPQTGYKPALLVQTGIPTNSLAVSKSSRAVIGGHDGLALFNLEKSAASMQRGNPELNKLPLKALDVRAVAFSPDDHLLAVVAYNGEGYLLDSVSMRSVGILEKSPLALTSVAFSPDGQRLLTGSDDGTATLWNIRDPKSPTREYRCGDSKLGYTLSVAFSPDGKDCAAGHQSGIVELWRSNDKDDLHHLHTDDAIIRSVVFSHDSRYLITGGRTCIVWSVGGERIRTIKGHQGFVLSALTTLHDDYLVTGTSSPGQIGIWAFPGDDTASLSLPESNVDGYAGAFIPDGRSFAYQNSEGSLCLRSLSNPQSLLKSQILPGHLVAASFSSDGSKLLTTVTDFSPYKSEVQLWDVRTLRPIRTIINSPSLLCATLSPDGNWVAAIDSQGKVDMWLSQSARWVRSWPASKPFVYFEELRIHNGVKFTQDSKWIVANGISDTAVVVYDIKDGHTVCKLPEQTPQWCVAVSPDRSLALTGGDNGKIYVWNLNSHKLRYSFQAHSDKITSLAFSADGQRVLSSSSDQTAILWDTHTWVPILTFRKHTREIWDAVIAPDGHHIVTMGLGGQAFLW